jgi:hypothetical protein
MEKTKWDRIHDLCSRVAIEQDPQKFRALLEELHGVLSADDRVLRNDVPGRTKA